MVKIVEEELGTITQKRHIVLCDACGEPVLMTDSEPYMIKVDMKINCGCGKPPEWEWALSLRQLRENVVMDHGMEGNMKCKHCDAQSKYLHWMIPHLVNMHGEEVERLLKERLRK